MTDVAQLAAALDRLGEALARQTEAINGLLQAFAALAGEEFGTPAPDADKEPSPHSTMDGGELKFRGARGG